MLIPKPRAPEPVVPHARTLQQADPFVTVYNADAQTVTFQCVLCDYAKTMPSSRYGECWATAGTAT